MNKKQIDAKEAIEEFKDLVASWEKKWEHFTPDWLWGISLFDENFDCIDGYSCFRNPNTAKIHLEEIMENISECMTCNECSVEEYVDQQIEKSGFAELYNPEGEKTLCWPVPGILLNEQKTEG